MLRTKQVIEGREHTREERNEKPHYFVRPISVPKSTVPVYGVCENVSGLLALGSVGVDAVDLDDRRALGEIGGDNNLRPIVSTRRPQ